MPTHALLRVAMLQVNDSRITSSQSAQGVLMLQDNSAVAPACACTFNKSVQPIRDLGLKILTAYVLLTT